MWGLRDQELRPVTFDSLSLGLKSAASCAFSAPKTLVICRTPGVLHGLMWIAASELEWRRIDQ